MVRAGLIVVAVAFVGTGCAGTASQGPQARRFDSSFYVKAQQPEIEKVATSMRACALADTPVTVTWEVAGDGHVEDIKIAQPVTPTTKEHDCLMAAAMRARFEAPANHHRTEVSQTLTGDRTEISQL